ncbi:hypothetical protein [Halovivax limisalsi]|uniref:hypothetical protein n=1 Tax=Halovivax limisalsi TaxID=1453760 RepID=UPI001FFC3D90|nr:hypothetical protein [Halovivax limisalsi]
MPSASRTRRGLLATASGCLGAALAGCFGTDSDGSSDPERGRSSSQSSHVDLGGDHSSTHEYEVRFARSEIDEPFVFRDEDAAQQFTEAKQDDPESPWIDSTCFVLDGDGAANLRIKTDADELRSFVDATEFDVESVVVQHRSIGDCYYRELTGVEARDDEFRAHYCRWLKDPTTLCEADRDVMEAVAIRVARPYADPPSSRGSSESAVCRPRGREGKPTGNQSVVGSDAR